MTAEPPRTCGRPRLFGFPFFYFYNLNQAELLINLSAHYNADLGQDELRLQAAAARVSRSTEAGGATGLVPTFLDPPLILVSYPQTTDNRDNGMLPAQT